jgi:hypothetical protein
VYSDAQTPVGRSLPGTCAVFVRTINTRLGSGSAFAEPPSTDIVINNAKGRIRMFPSMDMSHLLSC